MLLHHQIARFKGNFALKFGANSSIHLAQLNMNRAQRDGIAGLYPGQALDATAMAALRYERLALLFDPDADGIHIGALLVLYVQRWLPSLIEQGRLLMLRAPMFELVSADSGEVLHADHPQQCQQLALRLTEASSVEALERVCVF